MQQQPSTTVKMVEAWFEQDPTSKKSIPRTRQLGERSIPFVRRADARKEAAKAFAEKHVGRTSKNTSHVDGGAVVVYFDLKTPKGGK